MMKKILLFSSCVLLFLLTTACSKENQTITLLSMHTCVVTSNSLGGTPGDEYKFYDNRVFIHTQSGFVLVDGQWDFDYYYSSSSEGIAITTNNSTTSYYDIESLTNTELKLAPLYTSGGSYAVITLSPKQ